MASVYDQSMYNGTMVPYFDIGPCSSNSPTWIPGWLLSKLSLIEILFWLGVLIGGGICGRLADRYGARAQIIGNTLLYTLWASMLASAESYWFYLAVTFLVGCHASIAHGTAIVYLTETVGREYHHYIPMVLMFRVVGNCLYGGVAELTQNWRGVWLYSAGFNCVLIPLWAVLPESPRWLLSKGRYKKARGVLKLVAQLNKVELEDRILDEVVDCAKIKASGGKDRVTTAQKYYKSLIIWKNFILMCITWNMTNIIYIGLVRISLNLDGDIYSNFYLIASAEFGGILLSFFCIRPMGQKKLLVLSTLMAAISLFAASRSQNVNLILVFTILAKILASAATQVAYLLVPTLFPTAIRNSACGAASSIGRLGAVLAIWVISSQILSNSLCFLLMAVGGLITALLILILVPNCCGQGLPENILDVEKLEALSWLPLTGTTSIKVKDDENEPLMDPKTKSWECKITGKD